MINVKYKLTKEIFKKANKQLYPQTKIFKFHIFIIILYTFFVFVVSPPLTLYTLFFDITAIFIVILIIIFMRKLRLHKFLKDFEELEVEVRIDRNHFIIKTSEDEELKLKIKKIIDIKENKEFIYLTFKNLPAKRFIPKSAISQKQIEKLRNLIKKTE